jgi:ribosome-associated toxin RatA of RatAB toxin-antitoxin module
VTVAELATERMIMRASPERCYEVVTDFERYLEWAADIKHVEVVERDAEDRPSAVAFRAAAFGRSTSYTLSYDYTGAPRELTWVQTQGDLTSRLDGAYVFEPTVDGDTEVVYRLVVELKVPIPGFVKRRAEGRIMHTALKHLKARVESS